MMNVPLLLTPKSETLCLDAESHAGEAIDRFRAGGYSAVPVLRSGGRYYGTISASDILEFVLDSNGAAGEYADVSDIVPPGVNPPVLIDAEIDELFDRLMDSSFVPVVDGRDYFVGIVTRKALLTYLKHNYSFEDWNCLKAVCE